jgi:hypothetical protein
MKVMKQSKEPRQLFLIILILMIAGVPQLSSCVDNLNNVDRNSTGGIDTIEAQASRGGSVTVRTPSLFLRQLLLPLFLLHLLLARTIWVAVQ